MHTIQQTITREVEVKYIRANCHVRYWEDASINGIEDDEDNPRMPCIKGDSWCPTIDLDEGVILDWPVGTTASVHYKVCDAGTYQLITPGLDIAVEIDGYVPKIMCPGDSGWGDYIIMDIDENGKIADWVVILDEFQDQ